MGDVRTLYQPDDEIEALAIQSLLEEQGISCSVRRGADTAYPGIADRPGAWGEILVAEEDLERAQVLVAEYLEAEAEAVEPELGPYRETGEAKPAGDDRSTALERRMKRGLPWLLVLLLLAGSLVLNAKFLLRDRMAELPADQLDTFDAEGRLLLRQRYREGEQRPYQTVQYDAQGRPVWRFHDPDANGWFDRSVVMHGGSLETIYLDEDQDGIYETFRVERDRQKLHEGVDADGDQLYEEMRTDGTTLFDQDADGFYDLAVCEPDDGPTRRVDLTTCTTD